MYGVWVRVLTKNGCLMYKLDRKWREMEQNNIALCTSAVI